MPLSLSLSLSLSPLALRSLISTATYIPFPVMLTSLNDPATKSERASRSRAVRSIVRVSPNLPVFVVATSGSPFRDAICPPPPPDEHEDGGKIAPAGFRCVDCVAMLLVASDFQNERKP